ncbi:MAG: ABC transporter ATP-binding protein [Xanthobacteraceae bacterium]
MSAPAPAISVQRVTRHFGRVTAVDDVSLDIGEAEFLAVVGASGSGKTTLLRLINRLIAPEAGHIVIHGEDIAHGDAVALRRRIGMVFQSGALFPHMSVADNIGITPRLIGRPRREIAARIDEMMALVQLAPELRARLPHELSGGQRQRVGVARALAASPRIMLMDEPFGALDPLTRDALGQDYRGLHARLGLVTVMVTHDIAEALLLADRIAVMRKGRLIAVADPKRISQSGDAYVRDLLRAPRRQAERLAALLTQDAR